MATLSRLIVFRQPIWFYMASVMVLMASLIAAAYAPDGSPRQVSSLLLLTLGAGLALVWRREMLRTRSSQQISLRLARLPAEFVVLNNLAIPTPWGCNKIDHLVLSRFGVVVVADGTTSRWMLEQVEAVRSLLFSLGHNLPSAAIRPLVLVPPGTPGPSIESDAPIVGFERIRLGHLAPSNEPVFDENQLRALSGCMLRYHLG